MYRPDRPSIWVPTSRLSGRRGTSHLGIAVHRAAEHPVLGLTLTANGTLIAATHGRGAFETTVALPPALTIAASQPSIYVGNTEQLKALYGKTDVSTHARWTSSNTSVATVSASGLVTGRTPGTVTITASYEGEQATFTISVAAKTIKSVSVSISSTHLTVKGSPATLTVIAHYMDGTSGNVTSGASVRLSNSDVRVSRSRIYGMHGGTDTITVSYQGHTMSLRVSVTAVLTSITVSPSSIHRYTSRHFTATAHYNDGTSRNVTNSARWYTSNGYRASAYHGGLIRTRAYGVVRVLRRMEARRDRYW